MNQLLMEYLTMAYVFASFAAFIAGVVFRAFNVKFATSLGMIVFPTYFIGYGLVSALAYTPFKTKGK
jgi:predicted PurR-regulated permease PerM